MARKYFMTVDADFTKPRVALSCFISPEVREWMLEDITLHVIERMKWYIRKGGAYYKRPKNAQRHPATESQSKALIESGEMIDNIVYQVKKKGSEIHIGWPTKELNNRARLHEVGMSIGHKPSPRPPSDHWRSRTWDEFLIQKRVSKETWQKMKGYLFYQTGVHLKKTTNAIFIPARPFMQPAVNDILNDYDLLASRLDNIVIAAGIVARQIAKRKRKRTPAKDAPGGGLYFQSEVDRAVKEVLRGTQRRVRMTEVPEREFTRKRY